MTETAMVLTQQEWDDLAYICRIFRLQRLEWLGDLKPGPDLARQLAVCERVEGAA